MFNIASKICTSCLDDKPLAAYYAHPKSKDGLQSRCKVCMKEGSAKRYKEKRPVILAAMRQKYYDDKQK